MNTSNEEVEMKGECIQMEFQGPFLNDGSSSHIVFVISNCFYMCSYGNCSELEAVGEGGLFYHLFSRGLVPSLHAQFEGTVCDTAIS